MPHSPPCPQPYRYRIHRTMETTHTVTRAMLVEAFERWERDVRANPSDFLTSEQTDALDARELAEGCADALIARLPQHLAGH